MTRHHQSMILIAASLLAHCTPAPEEVMPTPFPVRAPRALADEWIVFSSGRSGNGDVYALHPLPGETRLVVGSPAPEGTVRYDAARDRIVVQRHDEALGRTVLVANGVDLFDDPNGDVAPTWSPRGAWIVYAAERDGQEDLFVARPDGTDERRLTNDPPTDRYPNWAPGGDRIVFARRLDTGWDLYTLDPFGAASSLERLTDNGVYVGHPTWSPDGRFIAFDMFVEGQAEIAMIEVVTGQITRLTNRAGNDLIPAWSPNGRRVAFGGEPDSAGNWDLWLVDVETLGIERLTTQPSYDGGPVFVPASAIGR